MAEIEYHSPQCWTNPNFVLFISQAMIELNSYCRDESCNLERINSLGRIFAKELGKVDVNNETYEGSEDVVVWVLKRTFEKAWGILFKDVKSLVRESFVVARVMAGCPEQIYWGPYWELRLTEFCDSLLSVVEENVRDHIDRRQSGGLTEEKGGQ